MKTRYVFMAMTLAALASCALEAPEIPEAPVSNRKVLVATMDDGTRTSISMNSAGTHADVVWNSGDKIRVFGVISASAGMYSREFTTNDGGSNVAEFYSDNWSPSSAPLTYLAFYPAERYTSFAPSENDGEYWFAIAVPPVQTAVKGSIERGLNQAVSYAGGKASALGQLHFKNVLSLVHFKLAGAGASKVRSVKLQTTYTVAGDGLYFASPGGEGYVDMTRFAAMNYDHTKYVTLEGSFEAGGDYYFAVAPGESDGFSLTFTDANGDFIIKSSTAKISPKRSHIVELGTINLDNSFSSLPPGVERYMTQTKGTRPVDLVVIGDGFTSALQNVFKTRARAAIDFLFQTEPYKTYRDWFNVYIIPTVSKESGASKTDGNWNVTEKHDTYYKTSWGANSYNDMWTDTDIVFQTVETNCPDIIKGKIDIDDVSILMLINDTRYAGICFHYPYGRSLALVPYMNGGANTSWTYPATTAVSESEVSAGMRSTTQEEFALYGTTTGNWMNIVLHEFGGHGFGRFADEYWGGNSYVTSTVIEGHSWPSPTSLNVSATYDNVPWKTDLLDNQAVMSLMWDSRYDRIGVFQGADTYPLNRWRSEKISCMIDNRPYYSTWQRVLIVKRIMELGGGTFDMETFLDNDDPTDPVRDAVSSGTPPLAGQGLFPYDGPSGPVKFYPPLPPPVMVKD